MDLSSENKAWVNGRVGGGIGKMWRVDSVWKGCRAGTEISRKGRIEGGEGKSGSETGSSTRDRVGRARFAGTVSESMDRWIDCFPYFAESGLPVRRAAAEVGRRVGARISQAVRWPFLSDLISFRIHAVRIPDSSVRCRLRRWKLD